MYQNWFTKITGILAIVGLVAVVGGYISSIVAFRYLVEAINAAGDGRSDAKNSTEHWIHFMHAARGVYIAGLLTFLFFTLLFLVSRRRNKANQNALSSHHQDDARIPNH